MKQRCFSVLLLLCLTACGDDAATRTLETPASRELAGRAPSSETFGNAVDAVLPAVVFIQTEARPQGEGFFPFLSQEAVPPLSLGAGSGVIFSNDGYILTADHVVQQAQRVLVSLHDRRRFEARVVARDPSTDIAVVKIDGENLPVASLGDSDALGLGDWVLAVGSPHGLQFTVTAGIVSAKSRSIGILSSAAQSDQRAAPLENFIQTDAAVNPGNSGGPLVDLSGAVVGINTAILDPSRRGTFAGYSFAVPINLARRVADDLIRYGEVRRSYLGVYLDDLTPADVAVYRLAEADGVEVIHVERGSPADRAGVQLGDVITAVNDMGVKTRSELQAALASLDAGTNARLRVIRAGETKELRVALGTIRTGVRPEPPREERGPTRVGFAVSESGGKVVVVDVRSYSPARQAGIRPGQVIDSVNGKAVRNVNDFAAAVRSAENVVSFVVTDPQIGQLIVNYELRP